MYQNSSANQSTTSLSDVDDPNASTFFRSNEDVVVSPAQWRASTHTLHDLQRQRTARANVPVAPVSKLPPEILILVLRHLHLPRDLFRALLVSRAWCECTVELLWHKPNFSKLSTFVKMMRILASPEPMFTYGLFIRRLNFLFLGAELTDAMFTRLRECTRLERLTLALCTSLSDTALTKVLECTPDLVAIDLTNVSDVSDRAIITLAAAARKLQGINLAGCKKVTNAGVLALAENCPHLRRVKLSHLDQVTDAPIIALAHNCPQLLEIDLNHCRRITDAAVRELWLHSFHMREMRLSNCVELTDAAFPAPPRPEIPTAQAFPDSAARATSGDFPPLRLPRQYEHLRMLDVTACAGLTDDAVEGIVAHAPKIRNLVFSKCTQLTDRTVEQICKLGKHLHYLHLGHAAQITDASVRTLARCCTRLRYVDFANCVLLTDMSVFELASLPKLRRIGLVRVANLTDEAIYALAERHATLERIHLSYSASPASRPSASPSCSSSAARRPPCVIPVLLLVFAQLLTSAQEFNANQRSAFCVYSGAGVNQLREFLAGQFTTMTEESMADDEMTEYDDEYVYRHAPHDVDMDADADADDGDDEAFEPPPVIVAMPQYHHPMYRAQRTGQPHARQARTGGQAEQRQQARPPAPPRSPSRTRTRTPRACPRAHSPSSRRPRRRRRRRTASTARASTARTTCRRAARTRTRTRPRGRGAAAAR